MPARLIKEPRKIKANKEHICRGCGEKILKKDMYYKTTCAMGGRVYDIKECLECHEYYQAECMNCEDFDWCIGENYDIGRLRICRKEESK